MESHRASAVQQGQQELAIYQKGQTATDEEMDLLNIRQALCSEAATKNVKLFLRSPYDNFIGAF